MKKSQGPFFVARVKPCLFQTTVLSISSLYDTSQVQVNDYNIPKMPPSDDDSSYSSNDDESSDSSDDGPSSGTFTEKDKKKSALAQFEGFDVDDEDDDDNSVAEKMKSIIELRKSLGMDNDAEFMKELREKEEEKKRLAAMSVEERMEYEESKAGDVMSKIRERHAEKMKEVEGKRKAEAEAAEAERARIEAEAAKEALIREQRERIERECQEEEERRKAEKRAKKKKKEQETIEAAEVISKSKETVRGAPYSVNHTV